MRLCALVLLAFFTANPASAQKLDVATIKCGDYIKYNKEGRQSDGVAERLLHRRGR